MDEINLARKGKPGEQNQPHRESAMGARRRAESDKERGREESGWGKEDAEKGKVAKGERNVFKRDSLKGHGFFFLYPVIPEAWGGPS